MLKVYLVRHGITIWNQEARWQGHTDVPLSDLGLSQASETARRLSSESIDEIWSSDLSRAKKTAEIIAARHDLTVQVHSDFRETMLGDWEGLTIPELVARGDGAIYEAMKQGSQEHRPPNSEPLHKMYERITTRFQTVRNGRTSGAIVIVGHGGSLKAILCHTLGVGVECVNRFHLDNASVTAIEIDEHRARIKSVNDTCHLSTTASG